MNVRDEKERWDSMRLVRLRRSNDEMFNNAMELYKMSFPAHEQRKPSSQAKIMGSKEYQFNLIYEEGQFVGILLCWEAEDFIYVEHFCIHPEMRNKRYGQRALELLNRQGKTVILEIDPPADNISIHRKGFYERAGYKENVYEHIHPPYHKAYSGHRLVVMSYPRELTEPEYNNFCQHLGKWVF